MKPGEVQNTDEKAGVIEALASIVTEDANDGEATPEYKTGGGDQGAKTEVAFKRRLLDSEQILTN